MKAEWTEVPDLDIIMSYLPRFHGTHAQHNTRQYDMLTNRSDAQLIHQSNQGLNYVIFFLRQQ